MLDRSDDTEEDVCAFDCGATAAAAAIAETQLSSSIVTLVAHGQKKFACIPICCIDFRHS
jgi:hypothetical protein